MKLLKCSIDREQRIDNLARHLKLLLSAPTLREAALRASNAAPRETKS